MFTFGSLTVVEPRTLRPVVGRVARVSDAITGDPVQTYDVDGLPAPVVTGSRGQVGQFQADASLIRVEVPGGDPSTLTALELFANTAALHQLTTTGRLSEASLQDTIGAQVDAQFPLAPERTTFFDVSTNLFDLSTITPGMVISAGSAVPTPSTGTGNVSDHIRVTPGARYAMVGVLRITYLDASGSYVAHAEGNNLFRTVDIPPGTATARLTVLGAQLNSAQMNAGGELLPYEPGRPPVVKAEVVPPPQVSHEAGNLIEVALDGLVVPTITPERTSFFDVSANLFVRDEATLGYDVGIDGQPEPVTGLWLTPLIPVTPGQTYTLVNCRRRAWYDAAGQFLSRANMSAESTVQYTAPANAAFMRVSVGTAWADAAQINEGAEALPYEPGGATLKPALLPAQAHDQETVDRYLIDTPGLTEVYTAPTIDAQPTLDATVTADVHGWYDALMAAHPDYITKADLGVSSDGTNHLHAYTLRVPAVPTVGPAATAPVALLFSGVHGYEKASVYHLWRLAKALCEEWTDSPVLEAIRWNVEIVIVPVGNPYSYDQSTPGIIQRANANGVDVNRNFAAGWTLGTPGESTFGGYEPLSEPESIALDALMRQYATRAVFGVDLHNFSTPAETPERFIWLPASSRHTLNLASRLISRVSRKWRDDHAWITETSPYFGWVDASGAGGTTGRAMVSHGFQGSTFEVSRRQRLDGGLGDDHTSKAMTLGYDAIVNFAAMGIAAGIELSR